MRIIDIFGDFVLKIRNCQSSHAMLCTFLEYLREDDEPSKNSIVEANFPDSG